MKMVSKTQINSLYIKVKRNFKKAIKFENRGNKTVFLSHKVKGYFMNRGKILKKIAKIPPQTPGFFTYSEGAI